jgi:predicted GTPase
VEKKPCQPVITKRKSRRINAVYRCAYSFVSALTKQRLLKALEATVKCMKIDNNVLLPKFNEFMLKVIEAYPPPATKGNM